MDNNNEDIDWVEESNEKLEPDSGVRNRANSDSQVANMYGTPQK